MKSIPLDDLIGKKYNKLTITVDLGCINKRRRVVAKCECGVTKQYIWKDIKSGNSKSCGCGKFKIHGLWEHKLYRVWNTMKSRCHNENSNQYEDYGGRGVSVCEEWRNDFKKFYNWCINNGWVEGLQIDKDIIPKMLDIPSVLYAPEFCCLVTPRENNRNASYNVILEHDGEKMTMIEWSEKLNINYGTLVGRLNSLKWSIERALTTPVNKQYSSHKKTE